MLSISGHRLGHRFPSTAWLFRGLSFDLYPGQMTAVCGPSGCGKSTLLSILAGWVQASEGTISKQGIDSTNWVFQNPHGIAQRTALDHVVFAFLVKGYSRSAAEMRAKSLLHQFNLSEVGDRSFGDLSGGEAQRLMLARAMAVEPSLMLVDEPTAQLDLRTGESVTATLNQVATGGSIVVIATHDPRVIAACHQVLNLGQTASDVTANMRHATGEKD